MKFTTKFTIFLTTILLFNCSPEKEQILQINGRTVGTDTKSIILLKPLQDPILDSIIEIPVIDGKFHYKSKLEYPEAVTLFLTKDLGRYMPLFLENEKIDLTIYNEEEFDKNIVKGGNLNEEYKKYKQNFDDKFNARIKPLQDSISVLHKNNEYRSDKSKLLYAEYKKAEKRDDQLLILQKIQNLKEDEKYSPKAKRLEDKQKLIFEEQKKFQQQYTENNPTIVSYSFLLDDLIFNKDKIDIYSAKRYFNKLSKANLNHPYNDLALDLINAIENIKVGKKFIDFNAPDLDGNKIKLSDKINGKVTLLDLWATWCAPCIAKTRTMIPLYNEYKGKGFTIVGVAGEFKNTDKLVKFLEKEKWEWLNLIELDRQNNIWQKYGVHGGGRIFLIDENGLILAKDPTAEEVRIELESRLK